jgi:hypothetical protein
MHGFVTEGRAAHAAVAVEGHIADLSNSRWVREFADGSLVVSRPGRRSGAPGAVT